MNWFKKFNLSRKIYLFSLISFAFITLTAVLGFLILETNFHMNFLNASALMVTLLFASQLFINYQFFNLVKEPIDIINKSFSRDENGKLLYKKIDYSSNDEMGQLIEVLNQFFNDSVTSKEKINKICEETIQRLDTEGSSTKVIYKSIQDVINYSISQLFITIRQISEKVNKFRMDSQIVDSKIHKLTEVFNKNFETEKKCSEVFNAIKNNNALTENNIKEIDNILSNLNDLIPNLAGIIEDFKNSPDEIAVVLNELSSDMENLINITEEITKNIKEIHSIAQEEFTNIEHTENSNQFLKEKIQQIQNVI